MAEQSKPAQAWSRRVAFLRDGSSRDSDFADLLATVDPRWHAALQASIYGGGVLRIGPAKGTLVRGVGVRVRRTTSGFSMELTRRQPSLGGVIVARARPALASAPTALARMLAAMFEDHEVTPSSAGSATWDGIVSRIRGYAAEDAAKAGLLESVDAGLRDRCEIYDNGRDFTIIRVGDSSDGEGVWISQAGDGWSFTHRVGSPQDSGARILGEATAGAENAAQTLNGLLEAMVSRMPAAELTAQDAYRELLRAHVAPALRQCGYTGSGGRFHRSAGDHEVLIHFRKMRYSTRALVHYVVDVHVVHPVRVRGVHGVQLKRNGKPWFSLRADDDVAAHAAMLLADLYSVAFPAIEERLRLPG
jgi:hypothetical protein